MDDSLVTIHRLLEEVVGHLKTNTKTSRSAAATKLHRIAATAQTLAFTIETRR